jgi:hypothetical protein
MTRQCSGKPGGASHNFSVYIGIIAKKVVQPFTSILCMSYVRFELSQNPYLLEQE